MSSMPSKLHFKPISSNTKFKCLMNFFIKLLKKHTHWMSSVIWVWCQVLEREIQEPLPVFQELAVYGKCKQFICSVINCCCVRWNVSKGEGEASLTGFLLRAFLHLVSWLFCVLEVTPPWPSGCHSNAGKCGQCSPFTLSPYFSPSSLRCRRASNDFPPKVQHWLPYLP